MSGALEKLNARIAVVEALRNAAEATLANIDAELRGLRTARALIPADDEPTTVPKAEADACRTSLMAMLRELGPKATINLSDIVGGLSFDWSPEQIMEGLDSAIKAGDILFGDEPTRLYRLAHKAVSP